MTILKPLNHLILIENILGIYRNYSDQNNIKKCFIIFQIFIQTIAHAVAVITELNVAKGFHLNELFIIVILSVFNYVSSVVIGICYSRAFMSYYKSITRASEWFRTNEELIKIQKKTYWFIITLMLFFIVFTIYRSTDILNVLTETHAFMFMLIFVSQTFLRFTKILECIMFFVVIMTLANLLKCISSLISGIQKRIASRDIYRDEHCYVTRNHVKEWVELYRDLLNCSENMKQCFGRQFYLSLILSIAHYIHRAYETIYFYVLQGGDIGMPNKKATIAIVYILFQTMPIIAGQLAHNQAAKFHRVLARLYNTMLIDSCKSELKLIKDFIRLMKKNRIEIQVSSKILVGVYILPLILMFTVNYVIIMLQYNNVV